jgi:hypothetical protein
VSSKSEVQARASYTPAGEPHKAELGLWAGLKFDAPVTWSLNRFRLARLNVATHLVAEFASTRQRPAKGSDKPAPPRNFSRCLLLCLFRLHAVCALIPFTRQQLA